MQQLVQVSIWNKPLGVLARNSETHRNRFEFFPSFLEQGWEVSPILFPMEKFRINPKVIHFEKENELPVFLTDMLPGAYARKLLGYALRTSTQTPEALSGLSYLSLLGNRGMGALGFEPSGYPELNETDIVDVDLLVKYVRNIYFGGDVSERRTRELLRSGLFTRGSWPKALVAINDFTGEVVSGQYVINDGFDGWVLKLDGILDGGAGKLMLEYEWYQKAMTCGILMAECRLLKDGMRTHLLCKRFDRQGNERIHIQSFAALREKPEDTYEGVFRCMRQLHLPHTDVEQFYLRMVFNVLSGNTHYRPDKIFFTCAKSGAWRLAPAFNLKPGFGNGTHTLSIAGKRQNIVNANLLELGKKQGVKRAKKILEYCQEKLEIQQSK